MTRSANLDFFAAEDDQRAVLDFLFSCTNVRVFESYSEYGAELREFRSIQELATAFQLGADPSGSGSHILFQLWSPSVMQELTIARFALNPRACEGHTFRHRIEGGGLMQLYFGGLHDRIVTPSHFGHQSEIRATAWGVNRGVNWDALKTLSNRIQYHIRNRLAAGKAQRMVVMPQALALAQAGYVLKLSKRSPRAYEVQPFKE